MKTAYSILFFLFVALSMVAQDTFSIVAVDSLTGEVGAAGASCVDLTPFVDLSDDFLAELFPGNGAVATQAWYLPANQAIARSQMQLEHHPDSIIAWLIDNDVEGRPDLRQYGITAFRGGSVASAAHTGSSTDDWKGQIIGPGYAIQGNILLGPEILEVMEERFVNSDGPLHCRLLTALQGANQVGADTRCEANGTSSLFAFVKVATEDDVFGIPSFVRSVRTRSNDGIEPIDSLQRIFDNQNLCNTSSTGAVEQREEIKIYPNPSDGVLFVKTGITLADVQVFSINGSVLFASGQAYAEHRISLTDLPSGAYLVRVVTPTYDHCEMIIRY